MKIVDITGQRFGRLVAISRAGAIDGTALWLCKCDCGNEKKIRLTNLKQGTKSCGCLNVEIAPERGKKSKLGERSKKHGDFGTKLYGVWAGMKRRCLNPNTHYYREYGGRGIKVCDEWMEYLGFKEWAMQNGYSEGLTIDRIDVNGNYEPSNCRWTTMQEQQRNRRDNVRLEYQGHVYSGDEIAEITGLKVRTIRGRIERGWDVERIITTKLKKNQYD